MCEYLLISITITLTMLDFCSYYFFGIHTYVIHIYDIHTHTHTHIHQDEIVRGNAERDKRHQMDMYTMRQKMQKEIEDMRAR